MSLFSTDPTISRLERAVAELQDLASYIHEVQAQTSDRLIQLASLAKLRDTAWQSMISAVVDDLAVLVGRDDEPEGDQLGADDQRESTQDDRV